MIDDTILIKYENWLGNRAAEISRSKAEVADFKNELKSLDKVQAILESIPTWDIDIKQISVRVGKIRLMICHREGQIKEIKESMKEEKKIYNFLKRTAKTTDNVCGKMVEKPGEEVEKKGKK